MADLLPPAACFERSSALAFFTLFSFPNCFLLAADILIPRHLWLVIFTFFSFYTYPSVGECLAKGTSIGQMRRRCRGEEIPVLFLSYFFPLRSALNAFTVSPASLISSRSVPFAIGPTFRDNKKIIATAHDDMTAAFTFSLKPDFRKNTDHLLSGYRNEAFCTHTARSTRMEPGCDVTCREAMS